MTETGDLEGKVIVTYTGLESSQRRIENRFADDTARKVFLENEVKEAIPVACDVELTNQPDWKNSSTSLLGEFTVKIGGWASGADAARFCPLGYSPPRKSICSITPIGYIPSTSSTRSSVGRRLHRFAGGMANFHYSSTAKTGCQGDRLQP